MAGRLNSDKELAASLQSGDNMSCVHVYSEGPTCVHGLGHEAGEQERDQAHSLHDGGLGSGGAPGGYIALTAIM